MNKRKILSTILAGLMVVSVIGCTGKQPAVTPNQPVTEPGITEPAPDPGNNAGSDWTLPEVNWGDGLFDGKTLIDDHFEEDENFAWGTYSNGGKFTLACENGEMVADIEKPGSLDYSCQLFRDDYELNKGGVYEVSFTVRCDIERPMQWRLQLNGGDYHAYYMEDYVPIGPEAKRIDAKKEMIIIGSLLRHYWPAPRLQLQFPRELGRNGFQIRPCQPAGEPHCEVIDRDRDERRQTECDQI